MSKPIRKVVVPVAGLGTRVLPATKSIAKELLPVVDRPLIHYVVDEAREAGIEHVVFVTGRGKGASEDYFDHAYELEETLKAKGKTDILTSVEKAIPAAGTTSYTRQQAPLGLGHAVWCARDIVGDEPFAVSLPDEITPEAPGFLKQLVDAYATTGGNLVAVEEVPREETKKYGVIAPKAQNGNLIEMTGMVEKPDPADAPSNFRIIGRYVLQPEIFGLLETQERGAGGEIQLTDSMNVLTGSQTFHACVCEGPIFDCGSKLGWLQANAALAMKDPEFADAYKAFLRERLD
ncbi:MAG: UTP--glucose-1-phosphate uridylyltransferase GalU [Parvularculaceae bacterium]